MLERYLESGDADAMIRFFQPADMIYFTLDSKTNRFTLKVPDSLEYAGNMAECYIDIGGDIFWMKFDVTAAGNSTYNPLTLQKKFKVRVK